MDVTLKTNHGDINVTLFPDHAPKTVKNFVGLAKGEQEYRDDAGRSNPTPFFDGLVFHRIIPGFMIQGGCPLGQGFGGPGYTFDDEISPDKDFTKPYMLAMANAAFMVSTWETTGGRASPSDPNPVPVRDPDGPLHW